ncbi:feruloyl-CoA synthase [Bradyrhizobium manausense]
MSAQETRSNEDQRIVSGATDFAPAAVLIERRPDGAMVFRSPQTLEAFPATIGAMLDATVTSVPNRIFIAERSGNGWSSLTYAEVRDRVGALAAAVLALGGSTTRPLAILSDNSIDVLLMTLAAQHIGVPVVATSPGYAKNSQDFEKLRSIVDQTDPAIIYAADAQSYGRSIGAVARAGTRIVVSDLNGASEGWLSLTDLLACHKENDEVAVAAANVTADAVARITFTSGSTAQPKGVITTHGMLTAHQQGIAQLWQFLHDNPPVLLDWLPWSHAFGANHNLLMALRHGGSLYIDDGRPVPGLIDRTVANLRSVSPTLYFNVPHGYQTLLPFLEEDAELAQAFFRRLKVIFYAGADMPPPLWRRYEALAKKSGNEQLRLMTGWGLSESTAAATLVHFNVERAGNIGLPLPGVEIKLAPVDQKLELRIRGPSITPGYWRRPDLDNSVLDEDGFFRTGDAGKLIDPENPTAGFTFDGRIGENFKLSNGRWVFVGELRIKAIAAGAPVVEDVVVAGHDRAEPALLIVPSLQGCRRISLDLASCSFSDLALHPKVRARVSEMLRTLAQDRDGAAQIRRALILRQAPSAEANEITDKGYINQRLLLARRTVEVEQLYRQPPPGDVIFLDPQR